MDCVLAIDQGTQSTRVFVYDKDARPIAAHQEEFAQIYPRQGWCEHDPDVLLATVQRCLQGALKVAQERNGTVNVLGIGIANQRETTIAWRRSTGKPCCNAVVWLDTRTRRKKVLASGESVLLPPVARDDWVLHAKRKLCHELAEKHGKDHLREITGLPFSTYFSGVKAKWMYDNVADVKAAMDSDDCMLGTVDSWLIYNLTGGVDSGVHVTDVSNASRTCLMDLKTCQWSPECLQVFGIKANALPKICSNAEVLGHVAGGPLAGVPIAGCLGDQQAALLGLLGTVAYQLGPKATIHHALEGSIAIGGMAVAWLRDQLGVIQSSDDCETIARQVQDTGGVYFVPAFGGLLAPHWRDDARGTLVGLSQFSSRAHIVRAVLEGIAFQVNDVLTAVAADVGTAVQELTVDGGATKNDLLMQMQADISQLPVRRPAFQEATSLGAALAAGLAVGLYSHEQVLTQGDAHVTEFTPAIAKELAESKCSSWDVALEKSFGQADLC